MARRFPACTPLARAAAHLPRDGKGYASGLSLAPGSVFGRRAGRASGGRQGGGRVNRPAWSICLSWICRGRSTGGDKLLSPALGRLTMVTSSVQFGFRM